MQINFVFDPSVDSAPAAFKTALAAAAQYLDNLIINPISLTIQVGWGEVGGTPFTDADGRSETNYVDTPLTYSALKQLYSENISSLSDLTALAHLPASDPTGSNRFWLSDAQAKAWGLQPGSSSTDGAIGFNSTDSWDFTTNSTVGSGEIQLWGAAIHEITEVMGRGLIFNPPTYSNNKTIFNLFDYSAPSSVLNSTTSAGYFSIDGGNTDLDNFSLWNFNDWANVPGGYPDAFNGDYQTYGKPTVISSADLTALDVIGFDLGRHDVATFALPSTSYNVTANSGGVTVSSPGLPTVQRSAVEFLEFSDKTIFIENADNANIARLYSAAFDRAPDPTGLSFWEDIYANNVSATAKAAGYYTALAQTDDGSGTSIAANFMQSSEFTSTYGSLTDAAFVTLLYQNVLGRAPDQAGLNFWVGELEGANPVSRATVLVGFAESPENVAKTSTWLITT